MVLTVNLTTLAACRRTRTHSDIRLAGIATEPSLLCQEDNASCNLDRIRWSVILAGHLSQWKSSHLLGLFSHRCIRGL